MNDPTIDTKGVCLSCGAVIPRPVHQHRMMGMVVMEHRQDYCEACTYLENFRRLKFTRRPYQVPFPRPTEDGRPPKTILEAIAAHRQEQERES